MSVFVPPINLIKGAGVSVYAGPGDVVSGAAAWWGLRAYSLASIGMNAVRLRESGGNTEQNFATIAGGGLDLAAIATFKGANNLFVVTLYDQTGNGRNITTATSSEQPSFILSGIGSLPVITWIFASSQQLSFNPLPVVPQPATMQFVAKSDSTNNSQMQPMVWDTFQTGWNGNFTGDYWVYKGASFPSVAASRDVWHSFASVFNNAASDLNLDGVANTVALGTSSGGGAGYVVLGGGGGIGNPIKGSTLEHGMWASAFSGAQSLAMYNNQSAYWGY